MLETITRMHRGQATTLLIAVVPFLKGLSPPGLSSPIQHPPGCLGGCGSPRDKFRCCVPRWQSESFLNLATRTRMRDGVSDARASCPPEPSHFWNIQRPFRLSTSTIPACSDESSSGSSHISCFRINNTPSLSTMRATLRYQIYLFLPLAKATGRGFSGPCATGTVLPMT